MGNKFDKSKMDTSKDEINFIGRTGINNGINALCGIYNNIEPYNAGYLTLSLGGNLYQINSFRIQASILPFPVFIIPELEYHFFQAFL